MQIIYHYLQQQYEDVVSRTNDAVQRNDYVQLLHLIEERQHLENAMNEIKSLAHADSSCNEAEIDADKIIEKMTNNVEAANQFLRRLLISSVDKTSKTITKGNQFSLKTTKTLMHKTANGLTKLADLIHQKC